MSRKYNSSMSNGHYVAVFTGLNGPISAFFEVEHSNAMDGDALDFAVQNCEEWYNDARDDLDLGGQGEEQLDERRMVGIFHGWAVYQ